MFAIDTSLLGSLRGASSRVMMRPKWHSGYCGASYRGKKRVVRQRLSRSSRRTRGNFEGRGAVERHLRKNPQLCLPVLFFFVRSVVGLRCFSFDILIFRHFEVDGHCFYVLNPNACSVAAKGRRASPC